MKRILKWLVFKQNNKKKKQTLNDSLISNNFAKSNIVQKKDVRH